MERRDMMTQRINSRWGEEKKILERLDAYLSYRGFHEEDCLDLKMAVAEACLNAIEHGNRLNPQLPVDVFINLEQETVIVKVRDRGTGCVELPQERVLAEGTSVESNGERGWGIRLIEQLVDEWTFYCLIGDRAHEMKLKKKLRVQEEG
jgi:serine/threonine-protein kinase RsbW